ncbi:MAG: type IV secretion system DNA-binding domain-containing protein [Candidatus Nealsonbacteria bacterium]|nr:type IV secretion system DNA-binding domain-containing protein [Candidatus Nealsonbacteria bacterium]
MAILYWIIPLVVSVLVGFLAFLILKKKEKEKVISSLDMTLFLVTMPKYPVKKEHMIEEEEKVLIGQMEQVLANFLFLERPGFLKSLFQAPPRITLEIASQIGGKDISFYVAVPSYLETDFEKYVQGIYTRALVEKVPEDYTIFEPAGEAAGSYLTLTDSFIFPINTYKQLEKDPLATLTNALSKIKAEEGAAVQVVLKPSGTNLKKLGKKVLSKIRKGMSLKQALREASRSEFNKFFMEFLKIFTEGGTSTQDKQDKKPEEEKIKVDEKTVQSIQEKTQKPAFDVNVRLLSSAKNPERAQQILSHLEAAFSQFSLFVSNGFKPRRMERKNLESLVYDFSFRNYDSSQKMVLNVEEVVSIYHFPTHYIETPYIRSLKSGVAPPPSELPEEGLNKIGKVVYRGEEKDVYFATREDRRRHFYIVGQTGTGKSGLLREMVRQDIKNDEGVAVVDPHGDLIEDTLANVPKKRVKDVVLFEPFDTSRPIGLNMLEYKTPSQKDFAVQEMIAIFHTLFPPEIIGPMFEHYMRNAMLALMADKENPGTLVEIPRMFTDDSFMKERLEEVEDPVVRSFWLKEWKQTSGATRSDMLGYVVSKVGRFIENEMMRNIIGQSHSGFDLGKIMDEGKIFLANLSKGLTGEVNASLLGLILVSKMQMAAMRRARIPEEQRKDFYLYIDEFQNFTTDSIPTILSEARKYRLNLILAHQYIPQLKDEIRDAVMGNVGTMGSYRIGADDAEFLEKQFEPRFSRFDLVNLDNFNIVCKLMINGKVSEPFKFETLPPKEGDYEKAQKIKEIAKEKYGRPKKRVEAEILERSKLLDY